MHSVICNGLIGSLECFVIIKCTKFGQLILRKITKIVATRCQILRLKCTKFTFDFGWGSVPDPAGELTAYSALPDPLAGFKGPTSKGREERGSEGEKEGKERVREMGEREREKEGKRPLALILQFDHFPGSNNYC